MRVRRRLLWWARAAHSVASAGSLRRPPSSSPPWKGGRDELGCWEAVRAQEIVVVGAGRPLGRQRRLVAPTPP